MESKRGIDYISDAFDKPGGTVLPDSVEEIRDKVIDAFEEIILFGVRVRPLTLGGKQVGFVRGLNFSEKAWIRRMYLDSNDRTIGLIKMATNLSDDLINGLSGIELRRLIITITKISRAENNLLVWAYPFSTTSSSERLYSLKPQPNLDIAFPGGSMRSLAPSDVFIQWRYLADLRYESKLSLRETSNAAMVVQAMIGKGAQQLSSDIKSAQKALASNLAEPWFEMGIDKGSFDEEDGWGHIHQDQSAEGLMREYWGMVNEDKHEQLMKLMAIQHRDRAEAERQRIVKLHSRVEGISYKERAMTDAEVKAEDKARKDQERERREALSRDRYEVTETEESNRREDRVWDIEL